MPRKIEITTPADTTDELVAELRKAPWLLGLRVQKGVSLKPAGDLVTVELSNDAMTSLLHMLDARGIGQGPISSYSSSEPLAIVSFPEARQVAGEISESSWEEMDTMIAKESNLTANTILVMMISGAVAAFGLASNVLHYVIAAMVIAPGFEPITRIALGLIAHSSTWRHGALHMAGSYGALVIGAMLATMTTQMLTDSPPGSQASYVPPGALLSYWTSITGTSVLVSAVAGLAGAVLIAANRSLLTAGVMIALALVPGAAIVGMGMVTADWALMTQGIVRWLLDSTLVLVGALIVFGWKQWRTHRRSAMI